MKQELRDIFARVKRSACTIERFTVAAVKHRLERGSAHNSIIWIVVVMLFGLLLGYFGMLFSPYLILVAISLVVFILIDRHREIGFYLIMIGVFSYDWFVHLGLIPIQVSWLTEMILIAYIVYIVLQKRKIHRTPIDVPVALFILLGLVSAIYNHQNFVSTLLAFRLDLRFILMFYVLISLGFEEVFHKHMIRLFIILLIIQIPVASVKYVIYGQGESAIGTYGAWGGMYSTFLPLIAISIFTGLFVHEKTRTIYLLCIAGFVLFSIVGGKKGLIYFAPILLIFMIFYLKVLKLPRKTSFKILPISLIMIAMMIPIVYFVPWLKPAIHNPKYLRDFIYIYEMQYTDSGNPAGRIPSITETFNNLIEEPGRFLLGYGPGSMMKSYFKQFDTRERGTQPFWIEYGTTELVQKPLEYGYLGFILYFLIPIFLLFKINYKFYNKMQVSYWRAISFGYSGMLFSYLIIGISYGAIMRSDLAGFIFWFYAATIYGTGPDNQL